MKKDRIIARGEFSDHCHTVCGPAAIERTDEGVFINSEDGMAVMKHILESKYLQGEEVWTGEHHDIPLDGKGDIRHGDVMLKHLGNCRYKYIQQVEYDPLEDIIRRVRD